MTRLMAFLFFILLFFSTMYSVKGLVVFLTPKATTFVCQDLVDDNKPEVKDFMQTCEDQNKALVCPEGPSECVDHIDKACFVLFIEKFKPALNGCTDDQMLLLQLRAPINLGH